MRAAGAQCNVGQVGGLEEDLATHHYERIITAVSCRDEDKWPVVENSFSLPTHGAGLDTGMLCDGNCDCADRGDEEVCGQVWTYVSNSTSPGPWRSG